MGTLIRGTVRKTLYSTNVSIHEDAIKHFKNGYLNIQIKESREGKPYIQLNEWEPTNKSEPASKTKPQTKISITPPETPSIEYGMPPEQRLGILGIGKSSEDNIDDLPF